ncbi:hypothetical protein FBU30_011265 [Linnemannia zychae]|nr:hypothetical protein FBU30_011265 [Linnemannia zychae]
MLNEGHNWSTIRKKLRPSKEQHKKFSPTTICTGSRVSYKLVRQAFYDEQPKSFRKDIDVEKSVELWLKDIQKDGGKAMFLKNQYDDPNNFVVAWSTSFQLQIWERRLKSMGVKESRIMRPRLNAIRKAVTFDEQQCHWELFQSDFSSAQKLIKYLRGWFTVEELPRWAVFHRKHLFDINTNNLLESWHHTLKNVYLENKKNIRADHLIYILQGPVDVDFRNNRDDIINGYRWLPLSIYDKRRWEEAQELEINQAKKMVALDIQENKAIVKSFTIASVEYTVRLDIASKQLLACSCPDFGNHQIACKHLYLVNRLYECFHVKHRIEPELPVDSKVRDIGQNEEQRFSSIDIVSDSRPIIPPSFPLNVREHITLKRAREQEAARIKQEIEDEKAFQDCETELSVLWTRIGTHLNRNKRQRACNLSYIQKLITAMRKVCQDASGLYKEE